MSPADDRPDAPSALAERHRRVTDLFQSACELAPAERQALLARACAGDDRLREEVERLLAADDDAGRAGFLEQPAALPEPMVAGRDLRGSGWRTRGRRSRALIPALLAAMLLAALALMAWWSRLAPADAVAWSERLVEARRLSESGQPRLAEPLLRNLLAERMQATSVVDTDALLAARALAECLHAQGRLEEASELASAVLDTGRPVLGPDHPALAGIEELVLRAPAAPSTDGMREER